MLVLTIELLKACYLLRTEHLEHANEPVYIWVIMVHFTVTVANEAKIDLVLIQPFLLYYVNHAVLMLTNFFNMIFIRKGKRFV